MRTGGRGYGRVLLALVVLGLLGWFAWKRWGEARFLTPAPVAAAGPPADARAPAGTRIKVEVLNATRTRGLARRATLFLRDRGFDVVASGNTAEQRAVTLVLDRSQHPDWANVVGRAMQAAVQSRPDTSRYVDVTVILGADWRPPPLPFYP